MISSRRMHQTPRSIQWSSSKHVGGWKKKQITASGCGNIAKRTSTTKVSNTVKTLLYPTFRGNTATEWENSRESETLGAYLTMKQQSGSPSWWPAITVSKIGLVIHPFHHWLAASPGGLVNDLASNDPRACQNPYAIRSMDLIHAATQKKEFYSALKNGRLQLKYTHNYFYQV